MAKTFSKQDIEILGYIAPEKKESNDQWDRFEATAVAGLEKIATTFIYLKANCTLEGAREAAKQIPAVHSIIIVKPNSQRMSNNNIQNIFGSYEWRDKF